MAPRRDEGAHESRRRRRRAVVLGVATYGTYQLVNLLRGRTTAVGRRNATVLVELERLLGIDVERRVQRAFLRHPRALSACNTLYLLNQVFLTPLAMYALRRASPAVYGPASRRILFVMYGGTLWHAIQPMAPPRLLDLGITDTISRLTPLDLEAAVTRSFFNPTAAMPSMHVALAVLTGRAMGELRAGPVLNAAAVIYPACVAVAVVATGNHFVLDVVGGLALAAVALKIYPGPAPKDAPRADPAAGG